MNVLAIETSTAVCSVALADGKGIAVERRVVETHIHSEKLQTLIQEVCSEAGIPLQKLDGIAVSLGPGSFTGLRIGVSAAKGLCYGLNIPLLGVSTFEALADAAFERIPTAQSTLVCIDARQGDFYVGRAERLSGDRSASVNVEVLPLIQVVALQQSGIILTDKRTVFGHLSGLTVLDVLEICSAHTVALRGIELLKEGRFSDLAVTEPLYLKDFVVKTKAEVPQKQ